jgi:hypothetical protein
VPDTSDKEPPSETKDTDSAKKTSGRQIDLSRALLASVARTNIATLQAGLAKQAVYWSGTRWVMAALEKRIEGFQDVDLQGVTEKLKSFVSLPDAGLVGRTAVVPRGSQSMGLPSGIGAGTGGQFDYSE